jgi:hypothetical protein
MTMSRRYKQLFTEIVAAGELRKVDFKERQYNLDNDEMKSRFVKDILCMANAGGGDGYIILGIRDKTREVIGIHTHYDSSVLEEIVAGVIEEPIQFDYIPILYDRKRCAMIHIPTSNARPHWPKREFGCLRKHVFYTRRASGNREASFAEIREMFLSSTRLSEVTRRKTKGSRHIVDELADLSFDDREVAMFKMLKDITREANLKEYRSIRSRYSSGQECALVRSTNPNAINDFAVFMYAWNVKRDNIFWSRGRIRGFLGVSGLARPTLEIKTRIRQSSLIHVAYGRIYTTALERWPYSRSRYLFSNEWREDWGKVMKWEDKALIRESDVKAKYEFFVPNVTSKSDLKERLQQLLLWVHNNIKIISNESQVLVPNI